VGHWPPQIGGSVSAAGWMAAAAHRLRPGRRWTRTAARAGRARASGRPVLLIGAAASGPQAVRPMSGTQSESGLRGRGTVTQAPSQADCDRDRDSGSDSDTDGRPGGPGSGGLAAVAAAAGLRQSAGVRGTRPPGL
jgi:hypothetical protein